MKGTLLRTAAALFTVGASSAYAATAGSTGEEAGPLIWALIGFGAFVIMVQAIPALIMLYSVIKGLAAPAEKPASVAKH